jgi:Immunity protein 8
LRELHSPDILDLPESYVPPDPKCFGFLLQAFFGPDDGPGEESFDMVVCTPLWLARELHESGGILIGRHYLLVEEYNVGRIRDFLIEYAKTCNGETWHEVAEKLGRVGRWEFEDYRP